MNEGLGENHPVYSSSLNDLAALYYKMGDYTKAEPLFQKALEIRRKALGENHPDYAHALSYLAPLYYEMGDYSKAEPLVQKALEIYRKALGENHPDYSSSLNDLAALYYKMGDYSKAEPLVQKALEIRRKALGENHPDYSRGLRQLGLLHVATSRQTKALDLLQESVSVEDKIVDQVFSIASERQRMSFIKKLQMNFYVFLSLVFQQFSQDQQAIHNSLTLVMRRKSIAAEAITVQREKVVTGNYPQLKSAVIELNNIRMQISQKSLAGPLAGETLDKYRQNLEELYSKKEQLETELARQIPELQIQHSLRTINSKTISNALPDGAALIEIVRFNNRNFHAMSWDSPRYLAFILRAKEPYNVQMIDLSNAESIDNMITSFRMSIIKGGSAQANQQEDNDDGRNLIAVDSLGSSLDPNLSPNNDTTWIDIGYELYKLIFHPLLSAIGEDCKKLFIAPDGDLSRLPFEVLPTSKDSSGTNLLIDDYSITYLTTARDILQINRISDGLSNESIVAADPDFDLDSNSSSDSANITNNNIHTYTDNNTASIEEEMIITRPVSSKQSRDFDRSTINFDRLEGTKYEGKEISELLCVQPWTAEKVLESKLKSYRSPRILHIATHGFFLENQEYDANKDKNSTTIGVTKDRGHGVVGTTNLFDRLAGQSLENPMLRSGLALAGANTWIQSKPLRKEAEDGILTAEDVSMMDLTGTELVVLSACETGLGQVQTGEGVFGLRRSFVLAGAKTLVMSLWKVPDEQTKELMVDFYKRLLSGKGRAEALREAQLAMKEKYPNPYYWGAFICQGNPGPMVNKNGLNYTESKD
jgi:CHAT domain-containing protein